MKIKRYGIGLFLVASFIGSVFVWAISATQNDTFEDGTTMDWTRDIGFAFVENVANGGPGGAGDHFLRVEAGNLPFFNNMPLEIENKDQWTGDFNALGGSFTIQIDLANLSAVDRPFRVGVEGNDDTRFVTTTPFNSVADGVWRTATFNLIDADMTRVNGTQSLSQVLDDVEEFRIISSLNPAWDGEIVAITVGIDNIRVASVPVELMQMSVE